jgi:alcohol-forming fatty acyl-CoA reductase
MSKPKLGLSAEALSLLHDHVNVIIHSAASIKFNEGLRSIVQNNTLGSLELLELAKGCKNLLSYVHISTIFTTSTRGPNEIIQERLYNLPFDAAATLERIMKMTDAELAVEAPKIVDKWPNTYSVAKAMAEVLLDQRRANVPISIARPPVVSACGDDILPGWIDSLAGATFFMRGNALGYMRVLPGTDELISDLFPVDLLASGILCQAWKTGRDYKQSQLPKEVPIYHYSSSTANPIRWATILDCSARFFTANPPRSQIRKPFTKWIGDPVAYRTADTALNQISCALLDAENALAGKPTDYSSNDAKLRGMTNILTYYIANEWFFSCDNVVGLINELNDADRRAFPMDVRKINWKSYMQTYSEGVQKYIFREKPLQAAQKSKL